MSSHHVRSNNHAEDGDFVYESTGHLRLQGTYLQYLTIDPGNVGMGRSNFICTVKSFVEYTNGCFSFSKLTNEESSDAKNAFVSDSFCASIFSVCLICLNESYF